MEVSGVWILPATAAPHSTPRTMTSSFDVRMIARRGAVTVALALAAVTGACSDGSKHATDGDSGAAAPATVRDMSATPQAGDSTAGVANATGQPASAGDTMGARAKDRTPGVTGGSPAGTAGSATPAGVNPGSQRRP